MKRLTVLAGLLAVAGCAETPWSRGDLVAEPSACAPQRFDIYFRDGEAQLTDAARHAVKRRLAPRETARRVTRGGPDG